MKEFSGANIPLFVSILNLAFSYQNHLARMSMFVLLEFEVGKDVRTEKGMDVMMPTSECDAFLHIKEKM